MPPSNGDIPQWMPVSLASIFERGFERLRQEGWQEWAIGQVRAAMFGAADELTS
jgi:hypothetical protein